MELLLPSEVDSFPITSVFIPLIPQPFPKHYNILNDQCKCSCIYPFIVTVDLVEGLKQVSSPFLFSFKQILLFLSREVNKRNSAPEKPSKCRNYSVLKMFGKVQKVPLQSAGDTGDSFRNCSVRFPYRKP